MIEVKDFDKRLLCSQVPQLPWKRWLLGNLIGLFGASGIMSQHLYRQSGTFPARNHSFQPLLSFRWSRMEWPKHKRSWERRRTIRSGKKGFWGESHGHQWRILIYLHFQACAHIRKLLQLDIPRARGSKGTKTFSYNLYYKTCSDLFSCCIYLHFR